MAPQDRTFFKWKLSAKLSCQQGKISKMPSISASPYGVPAQLLYNKPFNDPILWEVCVVFHPACGIRHHWAKGQLQMLMVYTFHMNRFQHFTRTDVKSYSKVRRLGRSLSKSLSNFTQRSTGSLSPLWFVINWWSDNVSSQPKTHLCSASTAVPLIHSR